MDRTLRAELEQTGFPVPRWSALADMVRSGDLADVALLLDAIEDAAAAAGLDGVTSPTRDYQPLPAPSPGPRTISGWRCPHPRPCGRAEVGADARTRRWCELTGDALAWASVTSG